MKFTYGNVASEEELEYILDTTGDEEKQDAFDVVFASLDDDQQREMINKTLHGTLPHRALAGAALEDPRVNEYGVLHLDDHEKKQEMELAFLGSRLEIPDQPAFSAAISARLAIDLGATPSSWLASRPMAAPRLSIQTMTARLGGASLAPGNGRARERFLVP